MNIVRVGVVGYTDPKFDKIKAWELLKEGFKKIQSDNNTNKLVVISGLTDMGMSSLAYYIARQNKWNIGGIAPEKALEHKWFPMSNDGDELVISGEDWGDETPKFLDSIDVLLRVGGGVQAFYETQLAHKRGMKVYEYDLKVEE